MNLVEFWVKYLPLYPGAGKEALRLILHSLLHIFANQDFELLS